MEKEQLIEAVLKNPEPASSNYNLTCYGGHGAGHGQLKYSGYWEFVRNQATGYGFEATDEFVRSVIAEHWRKLVKFYK